MEIIKFVENGKSAQAAAFHLHQHAANAAVITYY
jgi:hypothetical protein